MRNRFFAFLAVSCLLFPLAAISQQEAQSSSTVTIENTPLLTDDDLIGLSSEQMLQTIETRLAAQAESASFSLPHADCHSGPFQCSGTCVDIYPLWPQWWPAHKGKCNKRSGSCGRTLFLGCECFYDTYETIPCPDGVIQSGSVAAEIGLLQQ